MTLGLLSRRRKGTGVAEEGKEEEEIVIRENAVIGWGDGSNGKLVGGYTTMEFFPYPQPVITMTNVSNVFMNANNTFFVATNGDLYTAGNNGTYKRDLTLAGIGTAGLGTRGEDIVVPQKIVGGVPLYPREELPYTKEGGGIWIQPAGPIGPVLPPIAAGSGGAGAAAFALTRDGRAVGWGSGAEGQLGNGQNTLADSITFEKGEPAVNLTKALTTGSPTTTLLVESLPESLAAGQSMTLTSSGHGQVFVVEKFVKVGATSITVEAQVANFAYPIGTVVKSLGYWPQFGPDWVRTGGKPLVPAGAIRPDGGTYSSAESLAIQAEAYEHILTGIAAIAAGEKCCYYLLKSGEVYWSGQVSGDQNEHRLAAIDQVWAERPGGTPKAIAIAGSRFGYLLLLEDKTVRYVGVNQEGTYGNGSTEEKNIRNIANPGLTKVIAVAKGEYCCFALKDNNKLWVWGSNQEGQLGQSLEPTAISYVPIEIPALSNVVAISAHGLRRGNGANNGDVVLILFANETVATWGANYTVGTYAGTGFLPWGVLGDNTSETRFAPVVPAVSDVKGITANSTHMMVLVEPATLPTPTVQTSVAGKAITVSWSPVAGSVGSLPKWRETEKWEVAIVEGPTKVPRQKIKITDPLTYTSPVLASGQYIVRVIENFKTERPAIEGGAEKTAVEGKLTVKWSAPAKAEPSYVLEVRRMESPGVAGEDWIRVPPEIEGGATSTTFTLPPSKPGLGTETVEVRLTGQYLGSFKTRIKYVTVP